MDVTFKEAVELARNNEDVKKRIEEKDYFLNSVIVMYVPKKNHLDRLIVTFYSPKRKEVIQGVIKGSSEVEFRESSEAIDPTTKELDMDSVKIDDEKALEIAEEETSVPESKIVQILATLKQEEGPCWDMNLITSSLELHRVFIDADTGEVSDKEVKSLVKGSSGMPFV